MIHLLLHALPYVAVGLTAVAARDLGGRWVRGRRPTPISAEEAWDNGYQHGLDTAHRAVARFPKPYITMSEERGWTVARRDLRHALDQLRAAPDEAARFPHTDPADFED